MERILLISTGGTIAKTYGSGKGVRDLHIGDFDEAYSVRHILERMSLGKMVDIEFKQLLQKDSLDLTDADRQLIGRGCYYAPQDLKRILITHGTDTMIQTAEKLGVVPESMGQTVVLTGSLLPACVRNTDAEFNLGLALGVCISAPPGVYIAMNGVHPALRCSKNPETGIFEPI